MLAAMTTGHDGSMTTLHAGTAEEAVLRLVLMARFGMDLPADIIEEQIASALDLIVMSRRAPDGARYITTTHEVGWSSRAKSVDLAECVSFDVAERSWKLVREPAFVEQAVCDGILDEGEVERWRSSFR